MVSELLIGTFEEIRDSILKIMKGKKVYIVGVGSELRGDDFVGSYIARKLKMKGFNNVIDANLSPESYVDVIAKNNPNVVVFIDAVEAHLEPGMTVFAPLDVLDKLEVIFPTTHKPSYSMLSLYLNYRLPLTERYILGVQIKDTGFGSPMTAPVKDSAEKLVIFLSDVLSKFNP